MTDAQLAMSIPQLQGILQSEGYPSSSYGIGRSAQYLHQAVVLDKWSNRWVVYYIERGTKAQIRKHSTEEAACLDFLARLRGNCDNIVASLIPAASTARCPKQFGRPRHERKSPVGPSTRWRP